MKGESDLEVGNTKAKCLEATQYKDRRAYRSSGS